MNNIIFPTPDPDLIEAIRNGNTEEYFLITGSIWNSLPETKLVRKVTDHLRLDHIENGIPIFVLENTTFLEF